jgi:NADH-quinone oxidoreductase subunit N
MNNMTTVDTLRAVLPELLLIGFATAIYLFGAFVGARFRPLSMAVLAIAAAAIALFAIRTQWPQAVSADTLEITGSIIVDLFGHTGRWAILIAGLLLILLSNRPRDAHQSAEYTGSMLLIIAGLMLAVTANDLVLVFVGLELVSIPTYVVLYLGRHGSWAQEATAKYFFLSILSSALLLYGFGFLYGLSGSTQLDQIGAALTNPDLQAGATGSLVSVALILIVAGLGFRLTIVPFHFYAPDVYQGTSNANAGLLSTLPKFAGLLVLLRLVMGAMPGSESLAWKLALALSILTMTLGNIVALWQRNIRRLMAYSSIAHAGYILIGVAVGFAQASTAPENPAAEPAGFNGIGAALFYLAVYTLATLGTFAALTYLGTDRQHIDEVDQLAGISRSHPLVAAAIAIFMFSLAGIPPLAGFWGKFTLFSGAIELGAPLSGERTDLEHWFLALAIIGVVNAAIAAAYYLRVIKVLYFDESVVPLPAVPRHDRIAPAIALTACAMLVVAAGVLPQPPMRAAEEAGVAASQPIRQQDAAPDPITLNASAGGAADLGASGGIRK